MARTVPATTDIAIIGGGITGASLAWQLARRGAGRVTLFERSVIAAGASGRTGAILRRHYTNRPEALLAQAGWETFAHWPEVVGGEPVHTPHGLIITVDTGPGCERNVELLHRNVAMQRELGIPARVVSPADLAAMQPFARFDDLAAAAYEPDSGYVDAVAATRGMALAAEQAGATVIEGCRVLGIETDGGSVRGVTTSNGPVAAGVVVCAAGPWSTRLLEPIEVRVPLEALRVQIAIVQRPLALEADPCIYLDTIVGMFTRPWGAGRSLVGVGGGDQHDPVDPDAYDPRNDAGYPAQAIAAAARRIPALADAVYLHGHAGLYDMTPDTHPIIGAAGNEGPDGLYLALGFSGAGFKKGPAVGQVLAELIVDGSPRLVDLHPFRLDRFNSDAWQAPWSETEYVFRTDFGHRL